jgi:hypothetical protein
VSTAAQTVVSCIPLCLEEDEYLNAQGGHSDLQPELLTVAGQRWTFTTLPPPKSIYIDPERPGILLHGGLTQMRVCKCRSNQGLPYAPNDWLGAALHIRQGTFTEL